MGTCNGRRGMLEVMMTIRETMVLKIFENNPKEFLKMYPLGLRPLPFKKGESDSRQLTRFL
jgi:hypothetical protein